MNTFFGSFFSAGFVVVFANILSGCGSASQLSNSCLVESWLSIKGYPRRLSWSGYFLNSVLSFSGFCSCLIKSVFIFSLVRSKISFGESGLGEITLRVLMAEDYKPGGYVDASCNELLWSPILLSAICELPAKSGVKGLNLLKLFRTCWIPIELNVD